MKARYLNSIKLLLYVGVSHVIQSWRVYWFLTVFVCVKMRVYIRTCTCVCHVHANIVRIVCSKHISSNICMEYI